MRSPCAFFDARGAPLKRVGSMKARRRLTLGLAAAAAGLGLGVITLLWPIGALVSIGLLQVLIVVLVIDTRQTLSARLNATVRNFENRLNGRLARYRGGGSAHAAGAQRRRAAPSAVRDTPTLDLAGGIPQKPARGVPAEGAPTDPSLITHTSTPWAGGIADPQNKAIEGWVRRDGSTDPITADLYLDDQLVTAGVVCDSPLPTWVDGESAAGGFGFRVPVEAISRTRDVVTVSLRDPASGATIISREVAAAPLKDSYRGRVEVTDAVAMRGWAVNENAPAETFEVEVLLDGHPYTTAKTDVPRRDLVKAGLSTGRGGLTFTNPLLEWLLDGDTHTLALRFPDQTMSDEVKVVAPPLRTRGGSSIVHTAPTRPVAIIVPIYNAADDVEVCIERLLAYTPSHATIILIDDCSSDPRVREILGRYEGSPQLRILRNDENLGFTRTVNRGIAAADRDDVILLNSDARVTPGWLQGILTASTSSARIATVTAMSDRAGAFSAPNIGNDNPLPAGVDEITYARAFRRRSLGLYPRVPTGNGFCMWISRLCIDELGALDEVAFPRGYGEENDFCMRAGRAGWIHVIDDRTYVFHDRSKSFGESKGDLLASGRAVIDARYPEYSHVIRTFRESPRIALARNRARLALSDAQSGTADSPRVLFVISTNTGGTPQTNADLMNALEDAIDPWILRCDSREVTLSRVVDGDIEEVRSHVLRDAVEPIRHISPEYDAVVASWLDHFGFDVVHIRHLLWHSLSLPRIAKELGMEVVLSFHDFYALSPNLKLIDDEGVYLGDAYTPSVSEYRDTGWRGSQFPTPSGSWLHWWQRRFWSAIEVCDAYVTTSDSARDLIASRFPELDVSRFHVIEHGRDFDRFRSVAATPAHGEPLRILVPGGISAAKGREVLRAIAAADTSRDIEWHVLGTMKASFGPDGSRIVQHGSYDRSEFGRLVEKIAPHAGVVLSIWDETYCHTLTEMWSVGLPVFVLDFPNVAQRVRRFGAGWVLAGMEGPSLLNQITSALFDRKNRVAALDGVREWQHGWGMAWTTTQMSLRYLDIYRQLLSDDRASSVVRVGVLAPSSRDFAQAPESTHIRVWERTRNSAARRVDYVRVNTESAVASIQQDLLDGLLVQPTAVPGTAGAGLSNALDASRVPLIAELDDDLNSTQPARERHSEPAGNASTSRALLDRAASLSVSNELLRDRLSRGGVGTSVFPAALSDRLWRVPPRARSADGKMRALCLGNRALEGDLESILPALDVFAAANPDFRLLVVGPLSGVQMDELRRDRDWMSSVEVPESARQYPKLVEWLRDLSARVDFAIAPLEDAERNTHRSDLELLEYLGLGLRTVASAVGPYRDASVPGVEVVPNTITDWIDALSSIVAEVRSDGARIDGLPWLVEHRMLSGQQERFDEFIESTVRQSAAVDHALRTA